MNLKRHIFLLTLQLFIAPHLLSQGAAVVDRLIIKIDKESYTQSQIESYIKIKQLYLDVEHKLKKSFRPSRQWTLYLEDFLSDKIIYNESLISSGQLASKSSIVKIITSIKKLRKSSLESLNIDLNNEINKKHLRSILKTESFIVSRNLKKYRDPFKKESWYERVRKKHTFRYFNNSKKYIAMNK